MEQMVVDFRKMVNPLETLLPRSDQELGGFSTVNLDIIKEEGGLKQLEGEVKDSDNNSQNIPQRQFGRFHGVLNLDLPPSRQDVVQSGHAMFRTRDIKPSIFHPFTSEFMNWERCNNMILSLRGDRRKYFINIQADTPLITDLYQHRLFLKTPGQWETVVVPLSDFILTNWGIIQQQEPLDLSHVRTVGIGLIDKQYGPYCLDIEWIKVITGNLATSQKPEVIRGKQISVND